jgi:peroxiredoxin Q/BCP
LNTKLTASEKRKQAARSQKRGRGKRRRLHSGWLIALLLGGALLVLGVVFVVANQGSSSVGAGQTGQYPFQVGQPGPGSQAPAITLAGTDGKTFDLAALRGKTVLLYFQEGIECQPCWDQMKDIQARWSDFQALHIDQMVSITSDPLPALKQKVSNEGLTIPVLSDPNLAVSGSYTANQYGMMGTSRDGHTFVLVGPDGFIRWRADYGGAPKYTMDVPVDHLLADLRAGLQGK